MAIHGHDHQPWWTGARTSNSHSWLKEGHFNVQEHGGVRVIWPKPWLGESLDWYGQRRGDVRWTSEPFLIKWYSGATWTQNRMAGPVWQQPVFQIVCGQCIQSQSTKGAHQTWDAPYTSEIHNPRNHTVWVLCILRSHVLLLVYQHFHHITLPTYSSHVLPLVYQHFHYITLLTYCIGIVLGPTRLFLWNSEWVRL